MKLKIVFTSKDSKPLPASVVADYLIFVNEAVANVQLREMRVLLAELKIEPNAGTLEEFARVAPLSVCLDSASDGSIILEAGIMAVALFVLQQTVGESLANAWTETNSHKRLKSVLLRHVRRVTDQVGLELRRRTMEHRWSDGLVSLSETVEAEGESDIRVEVVAKSIANIPRLDEAGVEKFVELGREDNQSGGLTGEA